ncbi:MAG TPA: hypothetical protein VNN17_05630 [Terriglobia bacterium]|nr:hypothetical protein [Terriglobia bacterium]
MPLALPGWLLGKRRAGKGRHPAWLTRLMQRRFEYLLAEEAADAGSVLFVVAEKPSWEIRRASRHPVSGGKTAALVI